MKLDLKDRLMGSWIEGSIRYAARELAAGGPGATSSLGRLAELLFAEAVREYMNLTCRMNHYSQGGNRTVNIRLPW